MHHALPLLCALYAVPAPEVALRDLDRFPCRWVVRQTWKNSREHRQWVRRQADADPEQFWEWYLEAAELTKRWNFLDDATNPTLSDELRLGHLLSLRHTMGRLNYERGVMVPPVPFWRFSKQE